MNLRVILILIIVTSCSTNKPEYDKDSGNDLVLYLVNLYKHEISPVDGPRSGSFPTGSAFGSEAYEQYGFFLGTIITANRLLHEIDDNFVSYKSYYGVKRKFDPLIANVYWWDSTQKLITP